MLVALVRSSRSPAGVPSAKKELRFVFSNFIMKMNLGGCIQIVHDGNNNTPTRHKNAREEEDDDETTIGGGEYF